MVNGVNSDSTIDLIVDRAAADRRVKLIQVSRTLGRDRRRTDLAAPMSGLSSHAGAMGCRVSNDL